VGEHHDRRAIIRATKGESLKPSAHRSTARATEEDQVAVETFLRTRDELTFRALYRRHTPALYAVAQRIAGDGSDELVQDTWIRATERMDSFRWEASLRTWLIGIMVNCHRERTRRERRHAGDPIPNESRDPRGGDPGQRLDLERAIARLSPGYREVFVLHDIEGYQHSEIATMLGIAEGTCKSQLSRARATLRSILDQDPGRENHIGDRSAGEQVKR
jgi:RNA polymerase sigma-70 factor, ECF subfamily